MYTDETLMPFGKHAGVKMANVPADYLMFMYHNQMGGKELTEYIDENYDVIYNELSEEEKEKYS